MPEEVNIDDLIDLPNDEERARKLQVTQKVINSGFTPLNIISGNIPVYCNVQDMCQTNVCSFA